MSNKTFNRKDYDKDISHPLMRCANEIHLYTDTRLLKGASSLGLM